MSSSTPFLTPCSSSVSKSLQLNKPHETRPEALQEEEGEGEGEGEEERDRLSVIIQLKEESIKNEERAAVDRRRLRKKKSLTGGIVISRAKKLQKHGAAAASSSSSSVASSSISSISSSSWRRKQRKEDDNSLRDLALPLGMSFAAVISQILDGTYRPRDQIPADQLSLICTSAVKESVANIYGDRFDYFLLNFEKSFGSTLKTLRLIKETSHAGQRKGSNQVSVGKKGKRTVIETSVAEQGNLSCNSFASNCSCETAQGDHESPSIPIENFQVIPPLTAINSQIVLHGQMNQELTTAYHGLSGPGCSQSMLCTFEKSVMEQTRANDLKAFEISLIGRKLQLKESQLALSSYSNMLDRIKITMGLSKASFKEEKLRNQMLDTRHTELARRCIDLLVTGLIVMCCCLGYGVFTFAYQNITEATLSCSEIPKASKSWWIPKPVAQFSSGWLMLRCHVLALTRMSFGLLIILAIAYSVFQRSTVSTATAMPVTFILLILGFTCGISGKLCVDTLGGSGFHWILYWEALCLLHFFASIFPSALYRLLYGPISVANIKGRSSSLIPYWFRRIVFYFVLSFAHPALAGLLPFASFRDWKLHFAEKVNHWFLDVENLR